MKGLPIKPSTLRPANRGVHWSWAVLMVLAGCSIYRPTPLARSDAPGVRTLFVPAAMLLPSGLRAHAFDPGDGRDSAVLTLLQLLLADRADPLGQDR